MTEDLNQEPRGLPDCEAGLCAHLHLSSCLTDAAVADLSLQDENGVIHFSIAAGRKF
jgi:hypothetical protein